MIWQKHSQPQEINKSIKPIENYKKYIFFNNIKRSNNHFNIVIYLSVQYININKYIRRNYYYNT